MKALKTYRFKYIPNIGGNEERDTRSQPIALLKQFIQADNDDTGEEKLEYNQNRIAGTELADTAVHPR